MPSGIFDKDTGAEVAITTDHHYIHKGMGYSYNGKTASLAAAAVEVQSFKTPANKGKTVHLRPTAFAAGTNLMSLEIVEGSACTGGTLAVPRNRNRKLRDASQVELRTAATQGTAGTASVYYAVAGTGGTPSSSGGGSGGGADNEIVLKPDTMYSILITVIGASTASIGYYSLFWYEE